MEQEEQAIRSGPDFDIRSATWSKGIRADLDVLGYCPKCASYYPRSKTARENITKCEYCGTPIEYSDMLSADFTELFNEEKKKLGIEYLKNNEPVERFIYKIFLLDNKTFDQTLFDKKWHPEEYKPDPQKKCHRQTCQNIPHVKALILKKFQQKQKQVLFSCGDYFHKR